MVKPLFLSLESILLSREIRVVQKLNDNSRREERRGKSTVKIFGLQGSGDLVKSPPPCRRGTSLKTGQQEPQDRIHGKGHTQFNRFGTIQSLKLLIEDSMIDKSL
ncbi:hypothetical protein NPIL_116251 [Nephila pilipes]|uniref:Uncharacterized protein n=1 Tax=Nephila pilipes TaxID=299642 RepID=A0A8X6QAB8_NEPPI|nr:hypothetical protein NPIL_116251 [Nephila pilipes]